MLDLPLWGTLRASGKPVSQPRIGGIAVLLRNHTSDLRVASKAADLAAKNNAGVTVLVPQPFILRTGALEAGLDPLELFHQEAMRTRQYARGIVEAAGVDPSSPVIEVGRPVLWSALGRAAHQGCSTLVAGAGTALSRGIARLRLSGGSTELVLIRRHER